MSEAVLPAPHGAVVFRTVSDGAILLHTEDEVYYGLNAVGVRVWQLLPTSGDLDELCASLGGEYPDVPLAELRGDVVELLDELLRTGLLVTRS
ncbi:MAG: PqqD family protein [Gemmatimonadaceae bacterium]